VFGEIGARFAEAAEVDDALDAGGFGGFGKLGGQRTVLVGIAPGGGGHGVNQVVGYLAVFEGSRVVERGFDDFDVGVVRPVAPGDFGGGADQAADGVAIGEELRGEAASDVAGDPGDGDATGVGNIWQNILVCRMRFARLLT